MRLMQTPSGTFRTTIAVPRAWLARCGSGGRSHDLAPQDRPETDCPPWKPRGPHGRSNSMNETRPLTDDEYYRLLAAFRGRMKLRDRCMAVMIRRGGFRISELLCLTLGDVVDQGQVLPVIYIAKRHTKRKRAGYRRDLHWEAREALTEWIDVLFEAGWQTREVCLFHSLGRVNRPISRQHAWKVINRAAKRWDGARLAGPIGPHSLRKSWGCDIFEASGKNLRAAQEALRHTSPETTSRYLPIASEELSRLILGQAARKR